MYGEMRIVGVSKKAPKKTLQVIFETLAGRIERHEISQAQKKMMPFEDVLKPPTSKNGMNDELDNFSMIHI